MKSITKSEFAKLIKEQIKKEHGNLKGLEIEWLWFKRNVTYPTGLKGSTGNLVVWAQGFKAKTFLLTASYRNGHAEWIIR